MSSSSPPLTPPTSDSESEPSQFDNEHRGYSSSSSAQIRSRTFTVSTSSPHPFAASSKANRAPPAYEKKLFTPSITPREAPRNTPPVKIRKQQCQYSQALSYASPSLDESHQNLWDTTISSAIDGAKGEIDLSGNNLTFIPPSIIDLKNLVVLPKVTRGPQIIASAVSRPFERSVTVPARRSQQISGARPFLPTATTNALSFASRSKCEIELYLMSNAIRALPRELFALDCLVVLSLRQNKLTSLPPAIGQLTRLRELNVAINRLAYLPSEILKLRLTRLYLHPNPFRPSPFHSSDNKPRGFRPLDRELSVPSLSELMLRFLLSPATTKARSPTRLEASMTQTLDSLSLPSHLRRIIRASTAHGLASEKGANAEEDVTANVCPNPDHVRMRPLSNMVMSDGTFCTPVETMLQWVGVVAGVRVAETPQAWVPVLWRGCSNGCLAFLESEAEDEKEEAEGYGIPAFVAGTGEEGELFEFSDDE